MSWPRHVYTMEMRKVMAYRLDFWISTLGVVAAQMTIAWFLWSAIFEARGVDSMRGYGLHGLMLYYLLVPLVNRLVRGPEMSFMAPEIYDGSLSRYLVLPLSYFRFKYVSHLAHGSLYLFQGVLLFGAFVIFFGIPGEIHITAASIVMAVVAVLFASLLYFTISGLLELLAFWADNVWSLLVMQRFVINLAGGALLPLSFFPESVRELLPYTPFPALVSVPVRALMGDLTMLQWLQSLAVTSTWLLVLWPLWQLLWKRGSFQYSGVGI